MTHLVMNRLELVALFISNSMNRFKENVVNKIKVKNNWIQVAIIVLIIELNNSIILWTIATISVLISYNILKLNWRK